jgi:hypothetical protein
MSTATPMIPDASERVLALKARLEDFMRARVARLLIEVE